MSTPTLPRPRPRPNPVFYTIAGHGRRQDVFRAWLVINLFLLLPESIMLKCSNFYGVLYFESELSPHETPPVIEWNLIACPFDELVSKFKGYVIGFQCFTARGIYWVKDLTLARYWQCFLICYQVDLAKIMVMSNENARPRWAACEHRRISSRSVDWEYICVRMLRAERTTRLLKVRRM